MHGSVWKQIWDQTDIPSICVKKYQSRKRKYQKLLNIIYKITILLYTNTILKAEYSIHVGGPGSKKGNIVNELHGTFGFPLLNIENLIMGIFKDMLQPEEPKTITSVAKLVQVITFGRWIKNMLIYFCHKLPFW